MSSALRVAARFGVAALCWLVTCVSAAGEPLVLARGEAPEHPQQPQLAVDAHGGIHLVFGIDDSIRYCRSDDGGKSFSAAVSLPSVYDMSLGKRRGPRIAVSEKSICVTAIGGKQGKGRDGDVLALRSTDGGRTWSEPVRVNDMIDSAREGLHAMSAGPSGELCCVWLDLRNQRTEIMGSVSHDGGATWTKNVLVYRSPDKSVCECCHPSVAHDNQNAIHVMWRNSVAGARDMYRAASMDGGKSFGKATKLGNGTWPLNACPMDGGSLAPLANGQLATVWRRDKSIYLALEGQSEEQLLGPGEQPWIAGTADGPVVIWLAKRGSTAYLLSPASKTPVELSSDATDPVLAAGPSGRGVVAAAWESRDGSSRTIEFLVVSP